MICQAYQLGCSHCAGVEYEEHLHKICKQNIEILKLQQHVMSYNVDARYFDEYDNYDIYFLFNPFDYDIYEEVITKIVSSNISSSHGWKEKYLICYGDGNIGAILGSGFFHAYKDFECPYRGNQIRIFRSKTPFG